MKIVFLLLCFFIEQQGFSQIKIKLISPPDRRYDFELVNATDSAFIDIGHGEDMGYRYGHYYRLKWNAPDGEYELYVDDTLRERAFMKNSKKDSTWIYYYSNGKPKLIMPYHKGKVHGEMIAYNENGSIRSKGTITNDKANGIRTYFYKSGKIERKDYYENGNLMKEEEFDEKGKLKSVKLPSK
jgi:hypothetical protein